MTPAHRREDALQTRAVHPPAPETGLLGRASAPPVHRTATFTFDSSDSFATVMSDHTRGYAYSRIDNPTSDAFAQAVAGLEGGQDGQPFASGMAAITTTLLAFLSAGDHVVAQRRLYGGTHHVLTRVLPRWGIGVSFADSPQEAAAAMTDTTRLVWCETISNPTLRVADIPALAAVAHAGGALLAVDSTFATPVVCRPLSMGADLVVHSATKYIGGHSDATGGVVVGEREHLDAVRALRTDLGGSLAPDEAFLLLRGLQTLPLRVERQNRTAVRLAEGLAVHRAVERVEYPGLPGHPDHALAEAVLASGRFGGVVTLTPRGGKEAALRLCDSLRLCHIVTSLGGTATGVSHVASTSHRQLDDDALTAAGIAPGAVRVAVGLEDPDDLLADFHSALDGL
ncbi:aminotransferase class I/II-fold pyridoxal phosphate-dependent enzyme [Streptomyces sp. NBC_01336]|uniref:trans-sulfuration enzyme family protein n=1 Tax=Streptomyces sp. NBC_01336 TaxID=2903829 RepID=UPI002E12CC5D|nr:aminotransferase class I/II-fold pyridoxal phosphate-dependent enzyme [Streptomyces sp. NBC_01336]